MADIFLIEEFLQPIENLTQAVLNYNQNLKNNTFDVNEQETLEKNFKKGETIFDEMASNIKYLDEILLLEQSLKNFFEVCKSNRDKFRDVNNENISKLLFLKKRIRDTQISNDPNSKEIYMQQYQECRNELNKQRNETSDEKNRRECEEMLEDIKFEKQQIEQLVKSLDKYKKDLNGKLLDENDMFRSIEKYNNRNKSDEIDLQGHEIQQLQNWTHMKVGKVLFDSERNNWEESTSEFDELIMNKEKLLFLLDDTEGNKFGGYIHTKIDKTRNTRKGVNDGRIFDPKAFVFSLRSNGRNRGMVKCDILNSKHYAFALYDKTWGVLFTFGNDDITITKEKYNRNGCWTTQQNFNYNGNRNVLVGKSGKEDRFTTKRIIVIQME